MCDFKHNQAVKTSFKTLKDKMHKTAFAITLKGNFPFHNVTLQPFPFIKKNFLPSSYVLPNFQRH